LLPQRSVGDLLRAVDVWYAVRNAEALAWTSAASTIGFGLARGAYTGNWKTLQTGIKFADFLARAHINSVRGVFNTPLSRRAGAQTLGRASGNFAAAVAAGYVIGSVTGTAVSYAFFGDEGAAMAADLYAPGGASFWDDGIMSMGSNAVDVWKHYAWFMYHVVTPCDMHEAEPLLYWRVKRGNVWKFERARFAQVQHGLFAIEYPNPPEVKVDESEEWMWFLFSYD
jgi:hypothetical protein